MRGAGIMCGVLDQWWALLLLLLLLLLRLLRRLLLLLLLLRLLRRLLLLLLRAGQNAKPAEKCRPGQPRAFVRGPKNLPTSRFPVRRTVVWGDFLKNYLYEILTSILKLNAGVGVRERVPAERPDPDSMGAAGRGGHVRLLGGRQHDEGA